MSRRQPWPWEPQLEPRDLPAIDPVRFVLLPVSAGPATGAATMPTAPVGSWHRGRDAIIPDIQEIYGCDAGEAKDRATKIISDHTRRHRDR